MIREDAMSASLDEQIELLKNVEFVGVPVCGCDGQKGGEPNTESQQNQYNDSAVADLGRAALRKQVTTTTKTLDLSVLRTTADKIDTLNPLTKALQDSQEGTTFTILYGTPDAARASGFTQPQLVYLANLVNMMEQRHAADVSDLRQQVADLSSRLESVESRVE